MGAVIARRAGHSPAASAPVRIRPAAPAGRAALVFVALLAVAYVAGGIAHLPLGLLTLAGGAGLLGLLALYGAAPPPAEVRRNVSLPVLAFVASLLLLVECVDAAGLFGGVGEVLDRMASLPGLAGVLLAALLAMALSNVVNNWPAALLFTAAIAADGTVSTPVVAGALIGCTIGANLTMLGSLSTVFWASIAARSGLTFAPTAYLRAAAVPTFAALFVASVVAALST